MIEPSERIPDPPCSLCKRATEDCICPQCPECGSQGDSNCYGNHFPLPATHPGSASTGAKVALSTGCQQNLQENKDGHGNQAKNQGGDGRQAPGAVRERGQEGARPALGGALGRLRDLRDYLVTLPPELRNDATRKALSQLRFAISDIAIRIEPHVASGYMEEKDCRACGLSMDAPIHIGRRGSSASAPLQRAASGPIREAARAVCDEATTGSTFSNYSQHIGRTCSLVPTHLITALAALLGEAPPKAEQSLPMGRLLPEGGIEFEIPNPTPGATVQPQAHPNPLCPARPGNDIAGDSDYASSFPPACICKPQAPTLDAGWAFRLAEMYLHRGRTEGATLWADALEIIKGQAAATLAQPPHKGGA